MDDIARGTAADAEPLVEEARAFVDRRRDAEDFVETWVRLVGLDVLLPGETWTFVNEIFYAVEEHVGDRESKERTGGLDDDDLRRAVASQLPALEHELARLQAPRSECDPTPIARNSGQGIELLGLVRDLLAEKLPPAAFTVTYADHLERARDQLPPHLRAAAEAIGLAIHHFQPESTYLRTYDIDETVLRRRIADIEPRLAAAVEG